MQTTRLTGSYYTSQRIANYMVEWALRDKSDSLLEPSFGDGVLPSAKEIKTICLSAACSVSGLAAFLRHKYIACLPFFHSRQMLFCGMKLLIIASLFPIRNI